MKAIHNNEDSYVLSKVVVTNPKVTEYESNSQPLLCSFPGIKVVTNPKVTEYESNSQQQGQLCPVHACCY